MLKNTAPRTGLEGRPLDPESSTLTIRSPRLSHFFNLQGTICLDIAYVPPGGDRTDGKYKDETDNQEEDGDEDHDKDDDDDESDEKHTGQVTKKSSRRRLARKWSDKTKDFQVI